MSRSYLQFLSSKVLISILLFTSSLLLYLHNISPSVYGGDTGDLLSAIVTHGVPHPSGYPLYTLLGIIFDSLLPYGTVAWKVGVLSSLFTSFSVVLMFLLVEELVGSISIAIITSLTYAFTYVFWLYAEIAEVFSMHYFFVILLLYLSLRFFKTKENKYVYITALVLGFSLSNNETIILLIPSLLMTIFIAKKELFRNFRVLILSISSFSIGLLPYLYIPIAASHHPAVNTDNATTIQNFLHLVLRQDYNHDVSSLIKLGSFIKHYVGVLAYVEYIAITQRQFLILIMIIGAIGLLIKRKFFYFSFIFIPFFFTGPLFVMYAGVTDLNEFWLGVLERFYGFSLIFLLLFLAFGIIYFRQLLFKGISHIVPHRIERHNNYIIFFTSVFFLIPISLFIKNFSRTDFHTIWLGDYYGQDLLYDIPDGAYLSNYADTAQYNVLYIKFTQHGYEKINIGAPVIVNSKQPRKLNVFIDQNGQFERYKNWYTFVPHGLVYKIISAKSVLDKETFLKQESYIWSHLHIKLVIQEENTDAVSNSLTLNQIIHSYGLQAIATGQFIAAYFHDEENAKRYFTLAEQIDPLHPNGYLYMAIYYIRKNDCVSAENELSIAKQLNPNLGEVYDDYYLLYKQCYKNEKGAKEISNFIKKHFR